MNRFHFPALLAILVSVVCTTGCNKSAAEYIAQAAKLEASAKTEEARLLYAKALQSDPRAYEAEYRLGMLDQKAKQPFPALTHFERASESGELPHLLAYAKTGLEVYLANPEQQKLFAGLKKMAVQLHAKPGGELAAGRIDGYLAVMERRGADAIASFERVLAADEKQTLPDVPVALLQQLLGAQKQNEANQLLDRLVPQSPASAALLDTFYLHQLSNGGCDAARPVLERKTKLPGASATARLQLAAHERRCHGVKAEAIEIEAYRNEAKQSFEAEVRVGDYYAEQGNWEAALAAFDRAAALPAGTNALELDNRRASALMGLGRMSEAATALDHLVAKQPANASAKAQRGLLKMFGEVSARNQTADFQTGLEDLRGALAQDPAAVPPQIRLQWVLGLTRNLQFQEARAELQKILAAAPNAIAPQLVLAQLDLREGRPQSARKICDQILAQSPGLREARLIRALSLKTLNAGAEARSELAKLSTEFPKDESITVQYLATLADQPDARNDKTLAAGLANLESSKQLKSDTLFLLAEILWRLGDQERSLSAWKQIYERTGDNRALLRMSELRMSAGQMDEGCRDLASIKGIEADLRQKLQSSWWGLTALCHEQHKDYPAALAAHRKALTLEPKDPVLNNNLASFLSGQKQDLDQAVQFAKLALQASPNEAEFLDTLGWIYYQKKDLANSQIIYRQLAKRSKLSPAILERQKLVLGPN